MNYLMYITLYNGWEVKDMIEQFDELLHWQVEIADSIIQVQQEIDKYEELENKLLKRKEDAHIHYYLGLKNESKEAEYGLHYIQEQIQIKRKELYYLQEDFQKKIEAIITHYHQNKMGVGSSL
jgi:hypothetical protein